MFGHIFGGGGGGMPSPFGGLGGFLGGFGGGRRRGPARGEDTVHRLKVSLEELYMGKCRGRGITVTVNQIGPGMVQQMQSKCRSCDGEGEVMAESDRCKTCLGRKVVPSTKLLEVAVEAGMKDEQKIVFRGEGDQKTITLTEALCGFESTVTHLDGRSLVIRHPPGHVLKPSKSYCARHQAQ
ncbi:hypothetical protein HAZT_HAZT010623 [Hyalella azteca]|uniref:CR-type domain-containing protein n=1 Tax=Hyalella azteca TaxID=294128 RepID=A0A6A0HAW1_HYAAZ|nr:hypothetical protein HAZT_HAZT010623 [Hyalella azteca]